MFFYDLVNYTIFYSLFRPHYKVTFHVLRDPIDLLSRMLGKDFVGHSSHPKDFSRMDVNIGRLPGESCHGRLVDQDPAVGQAESLSGSSGRKEQGSIEAAWPMQMVVRSFFTNCMVS